MECYKVQFGLWKFEEKGRINFQKAIIDTQMCYTKLLHFPTNKNVKPRNSGH